MFIAEGVFTTRYLTSTIHYAAYTGNTITPSGLTSAPLNAGSEVLIGQISFSLIPIL